MSVDGTDFKINTPSPASTKWFSFKIRHAGLRYEVGLNIQTGDIVWSNGPFPAGEWTDIRIFLSDLASKLKQGEKVEADLGYRGWEDKVEDPTICIPNTEEMVEMKAMVRARHEMVNARLKTFCALRNSWRHDRSHHGLAFRCIVMMVQLTFESGNALPKVSYMTPKTLTEVPEEEDTSKDDEPS